MSRCWRKTDFSMKTGSTAVFSTGRTRLSGLPAGSRDTAFLFFFLDYPGKIYYNREVSLCTVGKRTESAAP